MATYTYKGTKITGTSTTAKVFKDSGISNAAVGNLYLNTEKGHVYKCTTAGKASEAKWKYIRTDIIGKPELGVKKLGAPVRKTVSGNNHYMQADWNVPADLVDKKNGRRATGMDVTWRLGIAGKDPSKVIETGNESLKTSRINLNNLTSGSKTYTRNSFYPKSSKKLAYVAVNVSPFNSKGNTKETETATRNFKKPRKPSIGSWSFNSESGTVSNTITTNAGNDYLERYDTRYQMIIQDTNQNKTWKRYDTSSTNTSIPLSYDVQNYQQLSYKQYVKITIKAFARGYAGNSDKVSKTYYVAYPAQPTITNVSVSSTDSTGKCTVYVKTNSSTTHPVDRVKLEYLANCTYAKESDIPGTETWTDSNIIDDAECKALAVGVTNLIPDAGKYTWVRVKSYHIVEALCRYSKPVMVDQLETPAATATDESVTILATAAGADGKSIIATLGWNETGTDDATGTELTWSTAEDAWRSTDDPDAYTFTWSDGPITDNNTTYNDSAVITIKNLDDATLYYIRARRYLEDETTSYSPYSDTATQLTSERPEAVVASCPVYVASNSALPVTWTFSGNSLQTSWQIVDTSGTIIASGEGSIGSTQINANRIAEFASGGSLTFTVQVSTGSGFVVSEQHTVRIVDPPTLTLTATTPLTAQPYSFTATSNAECNLLAIVTSQGTVNQAPNGIKRQTAGDTIWSDLLTPEWTAGTNNYTTTITLPSGLDFLDLGSYTLSVIAIDTETELQSDESVADFTVEWSHQAVAPVQQTFSVTADTTVDADTVYYTYADSVYTEVTPLGSENPHALGWYVMTETSFVTLTPIDTIDADGIHHQSVQIVLTAPTGSAQTDVYDIYRMTGDGVYLIGESFPLTYTAIDEYAPFGDALTQSYRIALRTVDGDVEFSDIEYVAPGRHMRFDWPGGTLELPYNIQIDDKYKKDVEIRQHMDGSNDAYWNSNITRTGSLRSDLIRLEQQEDVVLARMLAHYSGPVFVRTPDGSAYEADVQVSDMSTDGLLETIAIDATEIGLTNEFALPVPFELEG